MNLQSKPTLPSLQKALATQSCQAIGTAGELTARLMFQKAGYKVSHAGQLRGDLQITNQTTGEICLIEVKTARRGKDKKWRFCLVKHGRCDHRHADKVLLLAVLKSGRVVPFLIPVDQLTHQRQAVICSHPETYAGKFAQYRLGGAIEL